VSRDERLRGSGMTSQRTRERLVERLREQGITNSQVLEVMGQIPRHIFVDEALASRAYEDTALPIGHGQTISQPIVVAKMTDLVLGDGPAPQTVLEIGTGSGYQAAILSRLVEKVYSVERIEALVRSARTHLHELRIRNVQCLPADGNLGLPEHAPFDAIIITAGHDYIPDALLAQLADGGRLVAPLGSSDQQRLTIVTREGDSFDARQLDDVRFVPLRRGLD